MNPKHIEDSSTEQIHMILYRYLNGHRRLFGGALMQWIDELAGIVAKRHCGGRVITAAVDSLVFKEPAYLGEMAVMKGCITHVGKTSMEVRVDTYAEALDGSRRHINRAYLVMVAMDEAETPMEVPGIELVTDEERQEWEMGEKRYQLRKQRRKEQY
ncbi:MAG: acyl-CoA thioesterase [Oscillospiraceae bacterium]